MEQKIAIPTNTLLYLFSEMMNTVGRRVSVLASEKAEPITLEDFVQLVNTVTVDALMKLKPDDEVNQTIIAIETANALYDFLDKLDPLVEQGAERSGFSLEDRPEGEPLH